MRLVVIAIAAVVASGCNRTLDDDECKELVDKMVDLLARDASNEHVDKLKVDVKNDNKTVKTIRDTCVGKMTKSQAECVKKAKSFEDAVLCDK